jgi:hypothetical protein
VQYRRELVRVYLTNVESICRRFCEDRRQRLSWLREEGSSFSAWWRSLSAERRKQLTTEKGEAILKVGVAVAGRPGAAAYSVSWRAWRAAHALS